MGRPERNLPESSDGLLVEVTDRVIGARALLAPGHNPRIFNELVVGLLGRAMQHSPVEVCACVFMSNHMHLLLHVPDQQALSRFMFHFACNSSKKIGKIRRWQGPLWGRRYDVVPISREPEAQWRRLEYLLSHGVKEGLVESPIEWPGVHAAGPLLRGEKLEGYWFNKTKEWAARHRGQDVGAYDFATKYRIELAQLPAFRHLPPEVYQDKISQMIVEIQDRYRAKRDGNPVAGVEKILSLDPYESPTRHPKSSSRPRFHVASRQTRDELWKEYSEFATQYRIASEALRIRRNPEAMNWFPAECYPPALPFVGEPAPPRPPSPPTRRLVVDGSRIVDRGEIPVVEIPVAVWVKKAESSEVPRVGGRSP